LKTSEVFTKEKTFLDNYTTMQPWYLPCTETYQFVG